MSARDVLTRLVDATPTPAPTPAASDPSSGSVAVAIVLIVATVLVIVLALGFTLWYHFRLLGVIGVAVGKGAKLNTSNDPVFDAHTQRGPGEATIVPTSGTPGTPIAFVVQGDTTTAFSWRIDGGESTTGANLITTFADPGTYTITAAYPDKGADPIVQKVTIGTPPSPSVAAITLPFVVKNWGRLVIVIFGVGAISALIAAKVLDAAAGVGILGTLLGVGAVAATSGSGSDKSDPPAS